MEDRRLSKKGKFFDYSLLIIVLFLAVFGLVMVYSTSSYVAAQKFGDSAYYFKKQLIATCIGLVCMFAATFISYRVWYKIGILVLILAVASVLMVLTPFGVTINGARRWINVGFTTLQPAEFLKLGVILGLGAFLQWSGKKIKSLSNSIAYFVIAAISAASILGFTKNLSSAIIIFGIAYVMYIVANPRPTWLYITSAALAVLGVVAFIFYYKAISSGSIASGSFRDNRILAWRDPEKYAAGSGYQTLQALYAIGSGGFKGKGLGASMQKLGFIPEAQNDMIFSVICEELGLFGGICVIVLFLLMLYRFITIANNAPDMYGGIVVTGVMAHIAIQVVLNIAVVTNTIPNTGITLPFISYGGTSVLFLMIEMGIVLNVSRQIRVPETRPRIREVTE